MTPPPLSPVVEMTLTPTFTTPLVLVDLSSLLYPIWHMSGAEMLTNPNHVSEATVARVRALTTGVEACAVCCDSGRSFRRDLDPTYKATRGERDAALIHQMTLAQETLTADGLAVWSCAGYEADDLIATATAQAVARGLAVTIVSADKDLLQLVDDASAVTVKSLRTGALLDQAAVAEKFGVTPAQMGDYLALVGDASDNIKGLPGVGPKGAVELLRAFGTLEAIMSHADQAKPSVRKALHEHGGAVLLGRRLIALATNAPIPFDEALTRREPQTTRDFMEETMPDDQIDDALPTLTPDPAPTPRGLLDQGPIAQPAPLAALAVRPPEVVPADWNAELEPRNLPAAKDLAKMMFDSRLFSAYGTPQAVLSTIMAGRELGLPAMASLRAFHIIENRPALSASLIVGIVLKSGKAAYFRCTARTAEGATFETQRGDDPPIALTFTLAEGRLAFAGDDKAWAKSGWGRNPADLCVARASAKLARLVYPDVVSGLYDPDELRDSLNGAPA